MNSEKLFKFCFFLYKLSRKNLFIFLNSLPFNCLVFVLSELIFFGFFLTKFILKADVTKLTKSEFFLYTKLLKKGFVFTQMRPFLKKRFVFFKRYSISNFFLKFPINRYKNFKKDLLVNVLGRPPVIGLYEIRQYINQHGYNQNYNSKKRNVKYEMTIKKKFRRNHKF